MGFVKCVNVPKDRADLLECELNRLIGLGYEVVGVDNGVVILKKSR